MKTSCVAIPPTTSRSPTSISPATPRWSDFFAPNQMKLIQQHNQQRLDFDGLRGRLLSSSYIPKVRRALRGDAARTPATVLLPRRRRPRRLAVRHQDLLRAPRPMSVPHACAGLGHSARRASRPRASETSPSSMMSRSTYVAESCWASSVPAVRARALFCAC